MKLVIITTALTLSVSPALSTPKSYIIAENIPALCEGGRFLLQAHKDRLYIICNDRERYALSLDNITSARIVGVTTQGAKSWPK